MKTTLRNKKIKNGKSSLYLDFYPAIIHPESGKSTRREFLGLYIFNRPDNEQEREHNKQTKALAKNICAKRQIAIQNENFDFLCKSTRNESFMNYFKEHVNKRKETGINYQTWKCTYLFLYRYTKGHLAFKEVTERFCKDFKEYLLNTECLNSTKPLKRNSAASYYNIFKEVLNEASFDNFFKTNPGKRVKNISQVNTEREFLTAKEIEAIAKAECKDPTLKKAGLFSAMTGLRWSDIQALTWKEIQHSEENGFYIRFTTRKTNRPETLPISANTFAILGDRDEPDQLVFKNLKYGNHTTSDIVKWLLSAGVTKPNFTFHCFRHTYATLQLSLNTDLYTVSKLLGHKNIETTQIYAKVVDRSKQEAAQKISKLDI